MFRIIRFCWDIVFAGVVAAMSACLLQPNALSDVTAELIAFFGIQAAVALPTMTFTAGMLRPDGITISELKRYLAALRMQMHFWVVMLILDLLACILVVLGKVAAWKLVFYLPLLMRHIDLSWTYLFLTVFVGGLAALRIVPFVRGIISLLELNGELTEKAILMRMREKVEADEGAAIHTPVPTPEGYGRIIARQ